ncbi:putative methyltransferase-domain-containing protein [Paraphysoderma sedebokerense]|nr:putative methyltransferase-domain-containing protein [Paraphysoderma sedebokerense]
MAQTSTRPYDFNSPLITPLTVYEDPSGLWQAGIGATVWDSALVLSKFLEKRLALELDHSSYKNSVNGKSQDDWGWKFSLLNSRNVIELGSGTGILGMVVGRLWEGLNLGERHLILTDKEPAMNLLQYNVERNFSSDSQLSCQSLNLLNFSQDQLSSSSSTNDLIFFSDLIHWPNLFQPLVDTLLSLTSPSSNDQYILFAYERREFDMELEFFRILGQHFYFRNLKIEELDPDWNCDDVWVFLARRK